MVLILKDSESDSYDNECNNTDYLPNTKQNDEVVDCVHARSYQMYKHEIRIVEQFWTFQNKIH